MVLIAHIEGLDRQVADGVRLRGQGIQEVEVFKPIHGTHTIHAA